MARVIELILTYERHGLGTEDDPIRMCPQLFTKKGELVAEVDLTPKGDLENPKVVFNIAPLYNT